MQPELQTIARFLKSQTTLALATTGADGTPRSTPLFYVAPAGLELFWLSAASSEHSRSLERDPKAAVSVYRQVEDWKKIRGVQIRGVVSAVLAAERRKAILEQYGRRFRLTRKLAPVIESCTLYCLRPEWVRYLDNSKGFGYRFEWALSPDHRL